MPITYNTVAVDDVAHNSNVVQSVTYNGDEVWAAESRFVLNTQSGTTVAFKFSQSSPNAISVNWGDGTEETFQSLTVRTEHTFSVASPTIIVTCTDGETWSPGGGSTTGFAEGPAIVEAKLGKGVASLADHAFYGQPLESIVIPPGIQQLPSGVFGYCTYLESAVISNSTISIGSNAFYNCTRLTNVYIPPSVQSIGTYAFNGCTALTQVYIDDLSAWITTNFASSFSNPLYYGANLYLHGELLESLVIPQNVSEIPAFSFINCTSLEEVHIHPGVQQVGNSAFSGCSGLQGVYITDVSAWCGITFAGPLSNPLYYAQNLYVNGVLETQLAIALYDAPIKAYAFYGCTSIEQVSVSGSTTGIGISAFAGCTNLSKVVISASVQTVESAFSGCTALSELDIDMQTIPPVFSGTSLQTVVIGNHTEVISSSAFSNCTSLEYVTIGAGVTSIGGSAFYQTAIRDVTIPYGVTSIGNNAFSGCSSLERVHVLSASAFFNNNSFLGCSSITEVHIDNVSDWLGNTFAEQSSNPTSISKTLYLGNQLLSSVIIPQGKTSIPAYAFVNCENLLSVEIPSTVSFIGNYAFSGCTGIQELVSYPITPPTINLYTLQGIPADCPIYVDGSSVNAYKQASYWNERSDYIQEDNRVIPSVLRYATTSSSRSITLYLSVSSGTVLTIDWGDGSSTTVSATGNTSHNYSSTKTYDIYILEQARGQAWSPGCTISSNVYGLFGLGSKNNTYPQLKSVEMGTGMRLSASYGFSGCTGLTSYTVSKYITAIADYVFKGCINISNFTSYAVTPPTIQQHTLSDIPSTCPIYVPASSVQNYKSKAYWSARSAYIQAMT